LVTNYDNDAISYKTNAASPQFAVFSEVYYDKGWNAYIDGKPAPYTRVNYVLRGMPVPAGSHVIDFKFEPKSVSTARMVTMASSVLVYLLLIGAAFEAWRKRSKTI